MAKKAAPKRAKKAAKKRVKEPEFQSFEQAQPLALSSGSSPMQKLAEVGSMVVGLAFVVFLAMHLKCNRSGASAQPGAASSAAPAAAVGADWGPQVKLEVASKFKVLTDVWGIKADSDGNVYVLSSSGIDRYLDGKKHSGLALPLGGPNSNMSFDGSQFYVVSGNTVMIVPKDLTKISKKFVVRNSIDLVGVNTANKNRIYAGDYSQHMIYIVDGAGNAKGYLGSSAPDSGGILAVSDIEVDNDGSIYTHDQLSAHIDRFSSKEKFTNSWAAPWTDAAATRFCILKGKAYITGYNNQRIFIQNLAGVNLGNCKEFSDGSKVQHPIKIGAGMDGFLYVLDEGTIFKVKVAAAAPLPTPVPAPKEAKQESRAMAPQAKSAPMKARAKAATALPSKAVTDPAPMAPAQATPAASAPAAAAPASAAPVAPAPAAPIAPATAVPPAAAPVAPAVAAPGQ